jgi:GNAT superfamily N-acetyltransferase
MGGRDEDRTDASVWAVTCFFTRRGVRKRGVSQALARVAVEFARERGARAIEGYPITTTDVIIQELHVGTVGVFADAGFTEVSRPTVRRVVMRIDF